MAIGWKHDYYRYKEFFLNILSVYNSKPNLKIYLELILSIVTIIIFSIFAIKPTVLTIVELSKEIESKTATIAELNQKISNLQKASNLLQTNSEKLQYLDQAIPNSSSPETLIKQFEKIALSSNVQIVGMSSSDIVMKGVPPAKQKSADVSNVFGDISELPFSITVSGEYQNLSSYLKSIEYLRRPIKIDSIIVNANTTENGKIISLLISGRVPYTIDTKQNEKK